MKRRMNIKGCPADWFMLATSLAGMLVFAWFALRILVNSPGYALAYLIAAVVLARCCVYSTLKDMQR